MKLFNWILGRKDYLDWDDYKKKIEDLEEKRWQETTRSKFRISR